MNIFKISPRPAKSMVKTRGEYTGFKMSTRTAPKSTRRAIELSCLKLDQTHLPSPVDNLMLFQCYTGSQES